MHKMHCTRQTGWDVHALATAWQKLHEISMTNLRY